VDAIVVDALEKTYGKDVRALDRMTFSVPEGQVFGLLGPNGAGKSTTVRVLATLTRADGGTATVAGHDVARDPGAVRRSIGYVPQASGVDREATGRENLLLQGRLQGMRGAAVEGRAAELLETFGLADKANALVKTYSGGMKRRLDVAMGLMHKPQVLFLDEPTTGLDPEARAAMWEELERLADAERLTILLTTHYLEEADRLAQRVAIVSRGRVVVDGRPEDLKRQLRGDAVTVELADGQAELAVPVVSALADVVETMTEGRRVHARVEQGARAVPVILAALDGAGIQAQAVTVSRPSLDDVYLHHTGRDFHADDRAGGGAS
jgi:ABC-2 type transport system ATP-binding protein